MKTIKIFATGLLIMISSTLFAQTKTDTIRVWGNCGMCKKTIETATKKEGVESADWNKNTKMLTVVYDASKTTNSNIQKNIAAAGYDTEKFRGDDSAYDKLHSCCKYERKSEAAEPQKN